MRPSLLATLGARRPSSAGPPMGTWAPVISVEMGPDFPGGDICCHHATGRAAATSAA